MGNDTRKRISSLHRNLEPMVVFQDMEPGSAVLGLTPVGTFQQCFEFEAIAAFDEVLS